MSVDAVERLAVVFNAPIDAVVDAIVNDTNVTKAVRGGVAEVMASRQLGIEPGVVFLERSTAGSDRLVVLDDGRRVRVEVKVVDASTYADGSPKVDLRRTTGERLYRSDDFEILAACLVSVTGRWEYRFRASALLKRRVVDGVERLDPNVRVTESWVDTLTAALGEVPTMGFTLAERTRPHPQLFPDT